MYPNTLVNVLWFGFLNMLVITTMYCEKGVPLYNHWVVYFKMNWKQNTSFICMCVHA